MAVHMESLKIGHFRGIHHLTVENLNHINIIAGDNNSGKTSVLEALLLLRNPADFTNILRLARMRDTNLFFSGPSVYESFINLFPKDMSGMEITLYAVCKGQNVTYELSGEQKKIMMDPEDVIQKLNSVNRNRMMRDSGSDMVEVEAFRGELFYEIAGYGDKIKIEIDTYATASGREIKGNNYLNIVYLSPMDHVRGSVFNRILRSDSYKEICLHILQLFDPEIVDLLILKNEDNNRSTEYIKHMTLGNMPLSTYGDGIKKVLSIANGIAQAAGGILLIDEIETAIHSKYYDDIFRFLVKAAIQFDVQVFVTAHSIEAIDALLSTQDYEKQNQADDINVLTFKKEGAKSRTYSRILPGRKVYANREQFGFEVRL
ncbi:MAG TPA: AAA family ATPase [Clostridiales bacterium]|nr:AAA family ATPase [Clostridiales bacterium]